jgi:hypothetical protein
MGNADVISMPDKWEYPWYAAWDLAFHVLTLTLVDEDFGKQQLDLMLREHYLHPNGQIPAYEWNFGDVNPPVHDWSTIFTYYLEKAHKGQGDLLWLERVFQKLGLNFTWWVNRKDRSGRNVFEGGFLDLDNIGVFDRSAPLPTGAYLEQADGTAWMRLFCLNMLEIVSELAMANPAYVDVALKFIEHFLWIASSMIHVGADTGMWDEEDGFFYDVLRLPNGQAQRLKVRSMVGLLPLCAVTVFDGALVQKYPEIGERFRRFLAGRLELVAAIHDPHTPGHAGRQLGVYGGTRMFQEDPHWRDCLLCYEYFHGDNGAGLGASHQTGWTGCIARLLHIFATLTPEQFLAGGRIAYFESTAHGQSGPLVDAGDHPGR